MKKSLLPAAAIALLGLLLFGASFIGGGSSSDGSGELELEIQKTSFIMPAAHHVYANPNALNGKYYLFKAKLTNETGQLLEDVQVRYRVPGYIEWTELDPIGEMFPGQTATVVCYPKFPEDITEKMTESAEKAEIEISWDGADQDDIVEEDFSFKIVNRNDYVFTGIPASERAGWADFYDNDALLACYVTPNDPIVKYYTQIVQEKILKGDQATVSGDPKDAARFLMGIYEATRLSHMVYSGTKGLPQNFDDASSSSQHNRLPREVITGNTGLCLELSLLYASVLSAAGIDPVIFLVPGHAYPGFQMNGQYVAIEATAIGGEGLGGIGTVEQAFEKGQKQLQEFMQRAQMGDPRYTLVDVHALNQQGVVPMALKDDEFLRKKVDEIAQNFSGGGGQQPGGGELASGGGGQVRPPSGGGGGGGSIAGQRTPGPLSFAVPQGWQVAANPNPNLPIATMMAFPPSQQANAIIFDVPAYSLDEAMYIISQQLGYMGQQVQYQISGNSISGQTYTANGTFVWQGVGTQTGNGIRIIAAGAQQQAYQRYASSLTSIFNSIR